MLARLAFLATMPLLGRSRSGAPPPLPDQMTPMPIVANGHPTTMTSPRKPLASVSLKVVPSEGAEDNGIGGNGPMSCMAHVSATDAVCFFVRDWIDLCGETIETFENILAAYDDFRGERPWFPKLSAKKFSQTLTDLGSRRLSEDRRRKGKDGRRLVVFEIRNPRRVQQRRAAA